MRRQSREVRKRAAETTSALNDKTSAAFRQKLRANACCADGTTPLYNQSHVIQRGHSGAAFSGGAAFARRHGLSKPLIFERAERDALGLVLPGNGAALADFGPRQVAELAGANRRLGLLDVAKQHDTKRVTLSEFADYWEARREGRDARVLNLITLEFSGTALESHLRTPALVRALDWITHVGVWQQGHGRRQAAEDAGAGAGAGAAVPEPEVSASGASGRNARRRRYSKAAGSRQLRAPKVKRYCLMSVAGSYTDVHCDFGGTSVWYHLCRGRKIFLLAPPTAAHLAAFADWTFDSSGFLPETLPGAFSWCELRAGETLIIPAGWLHAVYTPEDSLVFGGNFLHSFDIAVQLRIARHEARSGVPHEMRFPYFRALMWHAGVRYAVLARVQLALLTRSRGRRHAQRGRGRGRGAGERCRGRGRGREAGAGLLEEAEVGALAAWLRTHSTWAASAWGAERAPAPAPAGAEDEGEEGTRSVALALAPCAEEASGVVQLCAYLRGELKGVGGLKGGGGAAAAAASALACDAPACVREPARLLDSLQRVVRACVALQQHDGARKGQTKGKGRAKGHRRGKGAAAAAVGAANKAASAGPAAASAATCSHGGAGAASSVRPAPADALLLARVLGDPGAAAAAGGNDNDDTGGDDPHLAGLDVSALLRDYYALDVGAEAARSAAAAGAWASCVRARARARVRDFCDLVARAEEQRAVSELEGRGSAARGGGGGAAADAAGAGAAAPLPAVPRRRESLPASLAPGQRIEAKYKNSARFFAGVVRASHATGTHTVVFDDGDIDERVPRRAIRGRLAVPAAELRRRRRERELLLARRWPPVFYADDGSTANTCFAESAPAATLPSEPPTRMPGGRYQRPPGRAPAGSAGVGGGPGQMGDKAAQMRELAQKMKQLVQQHKALQAKQAESEKSAGQQALKVKYLQDLMKEKGDKARELLQTKDEQLEKLHRLLAEQTPASVAVPRDGSGGSRRASGAGDDGGGGGEHGVGDTAWESEQAVLKLARMQASRDLHNTQLKQQVGRLESSLSERSARVGELEREIRALRRRAAAVGSATAPAAAPSAAPSPVASPQASPRAGGGGAASDMMALRRHNSEPGGTAAASAPAPAAHATPLASPAATPAASPAPSPPPSPVRSPRHLDIALAAAQAEEEEEDTSSAQLRQIVTQLAVVRTERERAMLVQLAGEVLSEREGVRAVERARNKAVRAELARLAGALQDAQGQAGAAGAHARRVGRLAPLLRQRSEQLEAARDELEQVATERDSLRYRTRTLSSQLEASFRMHEDMAQSGLDENQLTYLHSLVSRLSSTQNASERRRLLPVVAHILRFTPAELQDSLNAVQADDSLLMRIRHVFRRPDETPAKPLAVPVPGGLTST
eukprot:g1170.t1